MKKQKVKRIFEIIIVPVILILLIFIALIYNFYTGKLIKIIPNIYELSVILISINVLFTIYNLIDLKNGKL